MKALYFLTLVVACLAKSNEELCQDRRLKLLTRQDLEEDERIIYLLNCRITELIGRPFTSNPDVSVILLSNNFIRHISGEVFENLTQLQFISADHNLITHLSPNAFTTTKNLEHVVLQNNYLELSVYGNLFEDMSLVQVDMTGNNRELYPLQGEDSKIYKLDHVFGLKDVQYLYLSGNSFAEVQKDVFKNLVSLKELSLQNNKLTELPHGIFDNNINLDSIDLSENRLKQLTPKIFFNNLGLFYINLMHNEITNLPDNIFMKNAKLEIVSLSHNKLTVINPAQFYFAPLLKHLFLDHNRLSTLSEEIFQNNFELIALDLGVNEMDVLHPNLFSANSKLCCLSLASNNLTSIPDDLQSTKNLQWLILSENRLKNIDNLPMLDRLRSIYLDNNLLTEVPTFNSTVLLDIRLDSNLIAELPEGFVESLPSSLQYLGLTNNQLRKLPEEIFFTKNDLTLYIGMNPLKCACINKHLPNDGRSKVQIDVEFSSKHKAPYCIYDSAECTDAPISEKLLSNWVGDINHIPIPKFDFIECDCI